MKTTTKGIVLIISGILTVVLGQFSWIAPLANFAWMLFKDVPLFSWWYVVYIFIGFFVSLGVLLYAKVSIEND